MELRFQAVQQRCGREALFGSRAVYAPRMLPRRPIREERCGAGGRLVETAVVRERKPVILCALGHKDFCVDPPIRQTGTPVLALWEPLTDSLPWPFPRLHILNSQILFLGKQNSAFPLQGDLDQTSEMPPPTPFQLALGYFLSLN